MDLKTLSRLNRIANRAVHAVGEKPYIMSIDDGIAIKEAIEILSSLPIVGYTCDPSKNTICEKGPSCQTDCFHTSHKAFAAEEMTLQIALTKETEAKLLDIFNDVDVTKTPSFEIWDKHGNYARYVRDETT